MSKENNQAGFTMTTAKNVNKNKFFRGRRLDFVGKVGQHVNGKQTFFRQLLIF